MGRRRGLAHPGGHPHPRTGRTDRRGGPRLLPGTPASASAAVYGGVGYGPQMQTSCAGASTCWSPRPGRLLDLVERGDVDLSQRRDPRARRGRPHARHGLLARREAHHGPAAREAAEPALLGHADSRRACASPARSCTTRRGSRWLPARRRSRRSPRRCTPSTGCRRPTCSCACWRSTSSIGCSSSPAPSTAPTRCAAIWSGAASAAPPSTPTAPRPSGNAPSTASRTAPTACWWPPTSSPAASTWTASRTSSTTTCR